MNIFIHAGHGGKDSGAVGNGYKEKDLNLLMAKAIADEFILRGHTVTMARNDDTFLGELDIKKLENSGHYDCAIAIHMDSGLFTARGSSIWLHSKAGTKAVAWAYNVITGLDKYITTNRAQKVHKGYRTSPLVDYWFNRVTYSVSMLVEFGFITNSTNVNEINAQRQAIAAEFVTNTLKSL